jgi:hypothetical protein
MLRNVWDVCSGAIPAQFESGYTLEQAVRRLGKDVDPWSFSSGDRVVGRVSPTRVKLWRRRSFWRSNGYGSVFKGRFESVNGRVVLIGRFSGVRLFQLLSLLWSALFAFGAWSGWAERGPDPDAFLLSVIAPAVMAGLALVMFWVVQHEARDDCAWLSAQIRGRLQG